MIALLALAAQAEIPLPSYRDALARERWHEVNALLEQGCRFEKLLGGVACDEGVTADAIARVDAFERTLFADARLSYLAALASKYAGDDRGATRRYEAALALDPDLVEAWYDLGEIRMTQARYDDAEVAFGHVARLRATGEMAWLGPWRLAEVSALRHDPREFERHIERALELGFSFRQIAGLPNWRSFYADPALRPTLDRLLTVYADADVKASLAP